MAPRLDSGMIFGVGAIDAFQFYLVLLAERMLMLWLMWDIREVSFNET
jgi:hypothetical protein